MTIANKIAARLASLAAASALLLGAASAQAQTVVYYHTDALGSVVAVTDQNRNVLERNEYEPYGKVVNHALQDGPGYAGHVADAQTGLIYLQQRYYDDDLGEFPTADAVSAYSVGGTFHRYWYANNNPYKFTDPDGRQSREFNFENQRLGVTPPPRAEGDWMGPAIGVALTAVLAAPVAAELGMAALANPGAMATATNIAGEAAGVTGLGVGANRLVGQAAERLAAKELVAEGNKILGSQVGARTSEGLRVIDHLVESPAGKMFASEVKAGNGVRNAAQLAKDGKMATEGAVLTGKNAPAALQGQRVIIDTVERRYPNK